MYYSASCYYRQPSAGLCRHQMSVAAWWPFTHRQMVREGPLASRKFGGHLLSFDSSNSALYRVSQNAARPAPKHPDLARSLGDPAGEAAIDSNGREYRRHHHDAPLGPGLNTPATGVFTGNLHSMIDSFGRRAAPSLIGAPPRKLKLITFDPVSNLA
jgi:hypothetical protein